MNKLLTKIATSFVGIAMAIGVGVAVGSNSREATQVQADVGTAVRTCDFTAATTGNSNYGNTWTYASNFSVTGGANNNKQWAYCKFGGKGGSTTSATQSLTSSVKTGPITNQIAKFSVVINSIGTQSNVTVTSSYLYVYSDSGYSTQIDRVSLGTTYSSSGTLNATPTSGDYWAANSYYKWEITSTIKGKSNIGVCIDKLVWYQYTAPVQTYTVSFAVNTVGYGTVSRSSITGVPSGTSISTSNNTVTINGTTVTATPTTNTAQYTYAFTGWSNNTGTVTDARTITANFSRTTNTFTVDGSNITHGSLDNTSNIEYDGDLDLNIVPESGYTYPSSVSVTMGGNDISNDVEYENGYLHYSPVRGDIVITATCPAAGNVYSISTTVTNGTYSGDTTITDNGGVASVTISPTGDYKLPASVSVSGADHTFNASTGEISLSNATGNVTINAAMDPLTEYSITVDETNGSHTGASTIKESRTASLTFKPDSGYGQPASVTVTGATYTWTRGTGVLSLSNPTGNVSVAYVASENELTSISLGTQKTAYILGEDFSMPVVTAHYSVADDKVVTTSATESGYDPYSIGNQSITISYTEGGITQTSSYSVTVSAKSIVTTVTWNLVTAASDISAGDTVIIAGAYGGEYETHAMSTTQNNNNRGAADITVSNAKASITNSVQQFKVETGTVANTFSFKDEAYNSGVGGYIYAASSSSNHLKTEETKSANSSFTLSVSNNEATLTAQGSNSHNLMRYNSGSTIFSCYSSGQQPLSLYKKVEESSGTADLIRITASYNGGEKYVGDSISASDFTVAKQLNTGTQLIPVESGWTIDVSTLTSTSNNVTVSYTEGNFTKTDLVVVPATERSATLEEVVLSVGADAQLDGYIAWSGATWNLNDIKVQYIWSDSEYDTEASLQSLVDGGEATISPATPTLGAPSFTVTYSYMEVSLTNNTVTLDEAVRSDYVKSMSWGNTTAAHFKHFSGEQLTEEIVNTWHVKATFAGAGEGERLYWGDYDLYIGNKQITSLPYTWLSEDDGQALSIHYGEDVDGNDFVKTNDTAVGNICATINAIDHDETISGLIDKSTGWTTEQSSELSDQDFGTRDLDENISMTGVKSSGSTNVRIYSGTLRTYANNEMYFTPSNGAIIKTINLANISASDCSDSEATHSGNVWTIKNGTETITFTGLNKVTVNADIVVEYQINGSETTTVHYANQMEHFDAQKKVVEFAKFMNTTMNGTNVCSGTFVNLEDAWGDVADKYDELFGASTTLNVTELAWAKNMLKYANAAWGSDAENACVEKAMKTYEFCIAKYGVDPFMFESDGTTPLRSIVVGPSITTLFSKNSSTVSVIVIVSLISIAAIGGYFFLRKRKED